MLPEGQNTGNTTHKVILGSQPLGPVLLQEPLQEMPRRICNIWFQLEGFVQDIVIHLSCVSAIKRRLKEEGKLLHNLVRSSV